MVTRKSNKRIIAVIVAVIMACTALAAVATVNVQNVNAASKCTASQAKTIATSDAKATWRCSNIKGTSAVSKTYRNNAIWDVTFYGYKAKDKYNYRYYISKLSKKIMYKKQY